MNLNETIQPDSTQLNADDLFSGPITVTVTGVERGTADQPVNIKLAEFPDKAYRPCKSMRRVLVQAWGPDASAYCGRRLTLFNDESVKWGGQSVGGIRIKALSHIPAKLTLALTITRGKRAPFTVEPLADGPDVTEFEARIAESKTIADLDSVAADLKTCDLGANRKRLQGLWTDRRKTISEETAH